MEDNNFPNTSSKPERFVHMPNFAGHGLLGITQQVIDVICRERRELDYRSDSDSE